MNNSNVYFLVDITLDDFDNKEPRNFFEVWLKEYEFDGDWYNYQHYHYILINLATKKFVIPNPKLAKNRIAVLEQSITLYDFIDIYNICYK